MIALALFTAAIPLPPACVVVDQSDAGWSLARGFSGEILSIPIAAPEGAVVCDGSIVGRRAPRHRPARPVLPLRSTLEELSR